MQCTVVAAAVAAEARGAAAAPAAGTLDPFRSSPELEISSKQACVEIFPRCGWKIA